MPSNDRPRTAAGYAAILACAVAAGLALPAAAQGLMDKAERDEIVAVAQGDPTMAAAYRKARETLPAFLTLALAPQPGQEGFSVKVAIRDGRSNNAEYFWIYPFAREGDRFSGKLNNRPRSVHHVQMGDTITFSQQEIVDWTYMDHGAMKGNYTAQAFLKKASPEEREAFRQRFGLTPDF